MKLKILITSLWDLSICSDGSKVATAGSVRVQIFSCADGTLLHSLKGHTGNVVCVDFSSDGKLLASGSLDKSVIIWDENFKGLLKFTHDTVVTCLCFNQTSPILLSASLDDFALWTHEDNSVLKSGLECRATCVSWSMNGQHFAVALFNGIISIRNKIGEEEHKIDRTSSGTVSSLHFTYDSKEHKHILSVVDWSRRLALYYLDGSMVSKSDKLLDYDPCFVTWYTDKSGKFLLVGGSGGKVNLHTNNGYFLMTVVLRKDWVWSCKKVPHQDAVLTCSQDGTLTKHSLQATQVHSFYNDRYAYRDRFTDVMICLFLCDKKVKIKSRELVKKVAVYKNVLLIQHTDLYFVYKSPPDNPTSTQYELYCKVHTRLPGSIIMLCSQAIVSVVDKRVEQLSLGGVVERGWTMDAQVRYVKVVGGAVGREGVLLGLKDGKVMMLLMDNSFPIMLLQTSAVVKGISLNADRSKIAVIDEHNTCVVYDAFNNNILFQEPNASSVSWHESIADLLCFTFNGVLSVKFHTFPIHQQMQQGFVLSLSGRYVTCLVRTTIAKVSVPYSAILYQCLELNNFNDAYRMATLGVSDDDWRYLGNRALEKLNIEVAKKAYVRIRDVRLLNLCDEVGEKVRRGERGRNTIGADVLALQGDYKEAAQRYVEAGVAKKALDMFTDLKMFALAKEFVGEGGGSESKALMGKQADWAEHTKDLRGAVDMYVGAGELDKAIQVTAQNKWADMMIELTRKIDRGDRSKLLRCAEHLAEMGQEAYACELYEELGDFKSLLSLRLQMCSWEEGMEIVSRHPELKTAFYHPYALHLAEMDLFEDAQKAFHQAGLQQKSIQVLERLSENAVVEKRYGDAAYFYWKLSRQLMELSTLPEANKGVMEMKSELYERRADIYYAYEPVQKFMEEPFTYHQSLSLFNICRFLVHQLQEGDTPMGVSKVYVLYTLAKQAKLLQAYKLVRQAYQMLGSLVVPSRLSDVINLDSILVKSKPFNDAESLLPICYFCSTSNPLLSKHGNKCINCKQTFVFSFVYFELLPLIEFKLAEGISDLEACSLLDLESTNNSHNNHNDPFQANVKTSLIDEEWNRGERQEGVVVGREVLESLSRTHVLVNKHPLLQHRYYKLAFDDVPVAKCPSCLKMFHKDDFELLCLQLKRCPFCRAAHEE